MREIINYIPEKLDNPKLINAGSAWGDIPTILKDIIERFDIKTSKALEFGVEYGYSTSALSNYFETVIGVDTFEGDVHSSLKLNHIDETAEFLKDFKNVQLVKSDYRDYIKSDDERYDLIHIDIVHTYEHTYRCGEWALKHSDVVIFHDTESFYEVKMVCEDLAIKYNCKFYNYNKSNGLGILVKKRYEN